jgi:hypothetical protein
MKIRKTGLAVKVPLNPPRMIDGVRTDEYDAVIRTDVVRVDELAAFCREYPDMELGDLADKLDEGAFA